MRSSPVCAGSGITPVQDDPPPKPDPKPSPTPAATPGPAPGATPDPTPDSTDNKKPDPPAQKAKEGAARSGRPRPPAGIWTQLVYWSVEWFNPYTDPPDGRPRVLGEAVTVRTPGERPECPAWLAALAPLGSGYAIHQGGVPAPVQERSQATLAQIRRGRLERRLRQKLPLLADVLIAEELAGRPAYYAGETDPRIEAVRRQHQLWEDAFRQHCLDLLHQPQNERGETA